MQNKTLWIPLASEHLQCKK